VAAAAAAALVVTPLLPANAAPVSADDLDGVCATLRVGGGTNNYVTRGSVGYGTTGSASQAAKVRFEAAGLGRYRLIDHKGSHLYLSVLNTVMPGSSYGDRADWTVMRDGSTYQISATKDGKRIGSFLGTLVAASGTFTLVPTTGCAGVADVATGVSGTAQPAVNADGTLNGFIDAHTHVTAAVGFGGRMRCGTPFHPGGVEEALKGCLSHSAIGVSGYMGALIAGTDPFMDYKGWPTFKDWPTPTTLLHEQAYFRGIQRAWQSGERILNALLVANRVICDIYPDKVSSCDEMEQIKLQAQYLRDMQDYIDAQSGGAGKGWFRIAETPAEVRRIAASGKLAVIVGVENSELFGCREILGVPQCTKAQIDAGLAVLDSYGVSGLYPVHKFDNAFGGTRFDSGTQGAAVNIGNKVSTGHWWEVESCPTGAHDNEQPLRSDLIAGLLSTSGLPAGTVVPVYPEGPVCNVRGLTDLGRYLVDRAMDRGWMIHVDHMSVKTADAVLDVAEERAYPGVITAHTWSDRAMIARIANVGGFVASYANAAHTIGDREGFVDEWRANRAAANPGAITAYGFGSDVNGLGDQAYARTDAATDPIVYPLTALNGATLSKYTVGQRTYDINVDGVATYGLQADWTVDVVHAAGADGPLLKQQLMSGAEDYVRVWEAARAW
jgi:microsomal dipeptidase-like Zn-dependent dipeptidase